MASNVATDALLKRALDAALRAHDARLRAINGQGAMLDAQDYYHYTERRRLINEAENAALKQKALSLERRLELADLAKLEHDRLKDNLKKLDEWEKDFAVYKQREEDGQ